MEVNDNQKPVVLDFQVMLHHPLPLLSKMAWETFLSLSCRTQPISSPFIVSICIFLLIRRTGAYPPSETFTLKINRGVHPNSCNFAPILTGNTHCSLLRPDKPSLTQFSPRSFTQRAAQKHGKPLASRSAPPGPALPTPGPSRAAGPLPPVRAPRASRSRSVRAARTAASLCPAVTADRGWIRAEGPQVDRERERHVPRRASSAPGASRPRRRPAVPALTIGTGTRHLESCPAPAAPASASNANSFSGTAPGRRHSPHRGAAAIPPHGGRGRASSAPRGRRSSVGQRGRSRCSAGPGFPPPPPGGFARWQVAAPRCRGKAWPRTAPRWRRPRRGKPGNAAW